MLEGHINSRLACVASCMRTSSFLCFIQQPLKVRPTVRGLKKYGKESPGKSRLLGYLTSCRRADFHDHTHLISLPFALTQSILGLLAMEQRINLQVEKAGHKVECRASEKWCRQAWPRVWMLACNLMNKALLQKHVHVCPTSSCSRIDIVACQYVC